jgi:hypothetical protein
MATANDKFVGSQRASSAVSYSSGFIYNMLRQAMLKHRLLMNLAKYNNGNQTFSTTNNKIEGSTTLIPKPNVQQL